MSKNKQSSVEMMEEFLLSHCNPTICNVEWSDFKLMLIQAKAMHKEEMVCSQMDMFNHLNNLPYGLQYLEKRQSATDFSIQYYKERFETDSLS